MPVSHPKLPFFAALVAPALYNNNDNNIKIFYFPYWGLQGCTSQQVAIELISVGQSIYMWGIFYFTWLKWGKIVRREKIQCMKDLQNIKCFGKNWYQFILLRLFSRIWPFSTLVRFAQRIYHGSNSVNDNIYYFKNYLTQKAAYFASRTQP